MRLSKCTECGHDVSNKAAACIHCGHPNDMMTRPHAPLATAWNAVTTSRTPINVFALAMMACSAILGASATQIDNACDLTAFTYTLHIFLAISGMFFATILFCRKGMYHPEDLAKAKQAGVEDLGHDKPMIAAIFICLMVGGYTVYHLISGSLGNEKHQLMQCVNYELSIGGKPVGAYRYQYYLQPALDRHGRITHCFFEDPCFSTNMKYL
ncbi:MAG: hypothetical protein KJP15_04060 [Gammaproteobacteria bacterium]|nr:hypothetical protein [Gammaproteobacteria bacterium]